MSHQYSNLLMRDSSPFRELQREVVRTVAEEVSLEIRYIVKDKVQIMLGPTRFTIAKNLVILSALDQAGVMT